MLDTAEFCSSVHAPERDSSPWDDRSGASFPPGDPPSVRFRHSGWQRIRNLILASLHRTNQSVSRILNWESCGFGAYVLQSEQNPNIFKIAGSNCHDRFCTPCAKLRSQCIANSIKDAIGDKVVRFVTLTLRHRPEELAVTLDRLYDSFAALRRSKPWRKAVNGGGAFLELKWSDRSEEWHPHLHILVVGGFLPHRELRREWLRITTDSSIVDIRACRSRDQLAMYVAKYVTKLVSSSFVNRPDRLDEAVEALKGRKLCLTFGSWRGILLTKDDTEAEWLNLGSYNDWFARALRGDTVARRIMSKLSDEFLVAEQVVYDARPPPTASRVRVTDTSQMLLPPLPMIVADAIADAR